MTYSCLGGTTYDHMPRSLHAAGPVWARSSLAAASPPAAKATTNYEATDTDAEWHKLLTPRKRRAAPGRHRSAVHQRTAEGTSRRHVRLRRLRPAAVLVEDQIESGTGWPSFWAPLDKAVDETTDRSFGMSCTAVPAVAAAAISATSSMTGRATPRHDQRRAEIARPCPGRARRSPDRANGSGRAAGPMTGSVKSGSSVNIRSLPGFATLPLLHREATNENLLLTLGTLVALAAIGSRAQRKIIRGARSTAAAVPAADAIASFTTFEQCMATISGIGGTCQ